MFEGHFGLRENPFVAAHQTRYIYPSPEHQEALAHLRYGIENREPFVLITGEVGTGKTTALFDALSEWEDRAIVGLITNSSLTRAELLEEIALRLGMSLPPGASKPQIMVALEQHLLGIHEEGHRAILLLDEAQNLERELLEEIRLLSNLEANGDKLVQIFLVGQPELEGRLGRPELRQLRQRVAVHYRLKPLGIADAERYIHHRITVAGGHALTIFPSDACHEVHRLTNGIPREMNHLCSQAMICAFVEGASAVETSHVRAAANELEFQSVLGKERRTRNVQPAVERRQGPTVPGAAPPPEREVTRAGPAPAAPPVVANPARPVQADPPPPPAPPEATEPEPQTAPRAPAAPSAWEPAELEPEDSDVDEGDEGDDDRSPEHLDRAGMRPGARETEADSEPETGPPRFDPAPRAARPAAETPAPRTLQQAPAPPPPAAPPPAPAASSDDWQAWFQSLTSGAQSAVEADGHDLNEDAPDAPAEAPAMAESNADAEPAPRGEALPPSPEAVPEAEPAVQPAASASPFAEALRRAQGAQANVADEATASGRAAAALSGSPDAAPTRTPRRFADDDAAFDALPPRLREKMNADTSTGREKNPLPMRLMLAVALLIVIVGGAVLTQRFFFAADAPAGDTATSLPGTAEPSTAARDADPVGDAGGRVADGDAPEIAIPSATPPPATAASASDTPERPTVSPVRAAKPASRAAEPEPPAAASSAPATTFALSVGTYMNETRAREEQSKLSAGTNFTASVSTVQEDNVSMYRVMMGEFPTRSAAERAASDLISRGLVDEARVITRRAR